MREIRIFSFFIKTGIEQAEADVAFCVNVDYFLLGLYSCLILGFLYCVICFGVLFYGNSEI